MDFGEDLNLGMLSNDNDDLQEDFLLGTEEDSLSKDLDDKLPPGASKTSEGTNSPDNNINTSERSQSLESVAGKEGEGTPGANTSSPTVGNDLSAIYSSVATHLHETGVLPSLNIDETKIKSADDLQVAIQAEIDNGLETTAKQYKEAMQRGEPEDAYVKFQRQQEQLSGITEDVLTSSDQGDLRFKINAQDFLNRGFSVDEAKKFAQRSADIGEDANDARAALDRIKEHNSKNYQDEVAAKSSQEEKATDSIKEFINNKDEFIKGVKLNTLAKDNLIKQMTTAVGRDDKGNPLTAYGDSLAKDPVKTKAVTEYLFMVTKGFTDFSKINNLITSKATKNIDDVLRSTGGGFLDGGRVKADDQRSFSIGDGFTLDV